MKNDDQIKSSEQPTAKETVEKEKNNPVVKEALKKERQPNTPDDFSPLHNTREKGTSGGDQRVREHEPNEENVPDDKLS